MLTLSLDNYGLSRYGASLVVTVSHGHLGQLNVRWVKVTDASNAVRCIGESLPGAQLL